MGSSKRKSRQVSDEPEEPQEPFYSIRGILKETKTHYQVDWDDIDGKSFPPSWEPKSFVTAVAIQEWEDQKKEKKRLAAERNKKRRSTAGRQSTADSLSSREPTQVDEDDEESGKQPDATTTSGRQPSFKLVHGKKKPIVEVNATTSRSESANKKKPGNPRKSEVSNAQADDEAIVAPPPAKRGPGRPRKSDIAPEGIFRQKEQADNGEGPSRPPVTLKSGPSTGQKRKRAASASKVVKISSDDDSDVPLRAKRRRNVVPESSGEAQHAEESKPAAAPKKRGRPRKQRPMTPVVVSGTEEAGAMEIDDSELYDDPAAAQLQREVRSARKQSPGRQLSSRQSPGRQPSPEFDDEISDFDSSQIVRGTQQEPHRVEEDAVMEEPAHSQSIVDAAAASSLSAKNSAYEPSGSTFENTTVNSSSGVHTLPNLLQRRFGPDAVISDSQSYLDGSSLHISEQRIEAEQVMDVEDATTESQIVVEHETTNQMMTQDQSVPESSIAQNPKDAPQSDVAALASSEPLLELSTRNNTGPSVEAASGPAARGHQVSTRSPSPALGAARSRSNSTVPPTEAADQSIQSQSELQSQPQDQSSSSSTSKNKALVEASSSYPAALNQESGQDNSVQPQVTTQQSHVDQAAQQVSFQQPPTQQRPTLDFVQSPAGEVTTSSLGFNTQIAPAITQVLSIPSSPVASLPSNLPNTIGESAPSPIRSVSSDFSRQNTPSSNMELRPNGKPYADAAFRAMKAANRARWAAEDREEALAAERAAAERAAATHTVTSAPSIATPVLDMHSPKPASAVPARLIDREARSPSTVPPVEIIPEETPEESTRSEHYETLMPGQGPQINTETSRPYVSQDLAMHDIDNNQHFVSLEFEPLQRDHYKCAFNDSKALVDSFTLHGVLPANSPLAQQARTFVLQLHHIVNHTDLNNTDTFSQHSPSSQAEWDMAMSSKFRFIKSLLDAAKRHNLHVALLVDPGRLAAILQGFLQGINIMYNIIDGQNNVVNHESTATILLTSVESVDTTSLDMDMIVAIDGSTPRDVITRTQKMLSHDTLVPTISLVIPLSIEHIEYCLPSTSTMPEAERLHILLSTATNEREKAGWESRGTDTDFDRKASDIVSWILNAAEADWTFYGLSSLQLIKGGQSQSSGDELMVDNSGSNKRSLEEEDHEVTLAKRARIVEQPPLPLTINPADMHLAPSTIPTNSHVSDSVSVAASQHAAALLELNNAQAELREHVQALETLQYNSEEQRAQMVQAQKERNEAIQREERLNTSNTNLRANNASLRDEVLNLKKQLEVANAALLEHTVPERAELEKSKAEAVAAITESENNVKRVKALEEQLDYLRDQYQTRSNENTMLANSNDEHVKQIAELQIQASGERAKLKAINNDTLIKKYEDTVKQLRTVVKEREGTMQRMSEELTRLREPRGRVGTRASSIPRSPRAGTREPVSRQGSPSVQRPHPLRKEN